ncbi:response regulator transcription factor [Paenibacillus agricola]|uniref:Response regulator transcription factor n=1 Tax=Paenibacillus agricola TaxID=2716264 RepID=A0ABX0JGW0_9BACL|nr:response regulator transcription factor [Paenibacillus agricola]NHN33071.1 response regulator transcription factor [Paenibacillus agricola]
MSQILIVDDEPDIRALIRIHLERAGLQIIEAESGRQAIERIQEHPIELIILDIMMDDGNGFEVLHYLRKTSSKTLVVALSARREVQDKVDTLGLGADDYITKPFSPMELIARVQAQLRRYTSHTSHQSEIIRLNNLVLDVDNLILHNGGIRHPLTEIECELLQLFMTNPDRTLTRRDIYQHIWKHENCNNNNLSVFINRLRTMLENTADSPLHLHTVRGIGYRFSGDGR